MSDFSPPYHEHQWKLVECNGTRDLYRCIDCCEEYECDCTFDDDYS